MFVPDETAVRNALLKEVARAVMEPQVFGMSHHTEVESEIHVIPSEILFNFHQARDLLNSTQLIAGVRRLLKCALTTGYGRRYVECKVSVWRDYRTLAANLEPITFSFAELRDFVKAVEHTYAHGQS